MSVVSTLVFLSQYIRDLSVRMQAKAIAAITKRIKQVEGEQVSVEAHRSKLMIACHQSFYKEEAAINKAHGEAIAAINAKFEAKKGKLFAAHNENKRTISLTSMAASNELMRELAMLGRELDHLTK